MSIKDDREATIDHFGAIISSCDSMLRNRTDPVEIAMIHEYRARASEALARKLKRLDNKELFRLCVERFGSTMALESAAHALTAIELSEPDGNIEMVASTEGNQT